MKKILVAILVLSMTLFVFVACESQIESIELVNPPTKVEYDIGEELSLKGSKLIVNFSKSTQSSGEINPDMVDLSTIDMSTVGEKTVTVTYQGHTVTFKINVVDMTALRTNAINELNAYCSENYYSPENAELIETKKESGREAINAATSSSEIAAALASAKEDIDTVTTVDPTKVESFELISAPTILEYNIGDKLSLEGSQVKIKLVIGEVTTKAIETSMVDLSAIDMSTVGEKTVTVTYQGHTVTFKINVVDMTALKTNAINELNAYCSENYYSPENAELIKIKKESGRAAINAATSSSAIAAALASAKEDIDTVKAVVSTVEISIGDSIKAFEQAEFTITTTAENADGVMVIGTGSFSDPSAILKIEYLEVKNNTWYEMPVDGIFGVATGFPLTNATSTFRVTFAVAGTYEFTTNMVAVDDETVLCSDTIEIVVGGVDETKVTAVKSEDELVAALANTEIDTIAFTEDITVGKKLAINRSVQIIGNNHTLRSTLVGNNYTGIFTANGVSGVNLTIVDLKIVSGEDDNTTIKAVGVVFEKTTDCKLYVNNVDINVLIYGIHSRTNEGFNARIFNSNIHGYGAYYSRASKNETVLIEKSEMNGTAYYNGTSNSFATISVQYGGGVGGCENVSITVIDSVVKSGTVSDQGSVPFLFVGAGEGFENINTTLKVYNTKIILDGVELTEDKYASAIEVNDESTTATKSVTGLVITIDGKTPNYVTSLLYDWLIEIYTDIYNEQSVEGGVLETYALESLIFKSYYGKYCFENGKLVVYTAALPTDELYQIDDVDGWDTVIIYAKPTV